MRKIEKSIQRDRRMKSKTKTRNLCFEPLECRKVAAVLVGLSADSSSIELDGKPAALVGASNYTIANGPSTTDTMFLDALKANNNNFTRVWTQFHFASGASPFVKSQGKYDLTKIDPDYLNRLQGFVQQANARNIVVQVCLFDTVQFETEANNRWRFSPYNPNKSQDAFLRNDDSRFKEFLKTDSNLWKKVNSNLIDKVVSALKNESNVVYEVMNEPTVSQRFKDLPNEVVEFHRAAVTRIRSNLEGGTGSKLVSVNTQASGQLFNWSRGEVDIGGRRRSDPRVDMISYHIADKKDADKLRSFPIPVIISTDSKLSKPVVDVQDIVSLALGGNVRYGSRHVELLDNELLGGSRGTFTSTNYKIDTWRISTSKAILGIGNAPLAIGKSFVGDFLGNGRKDSAVWYSTFTGNEVGIWQIRDAVTGQIQMFQWGLPGDIPVPGDYTGSGRLDLAVWRPSNQTWYIRELSTNNTIQKQWGLAGDMPFPGNYLGSGHTDLVVFRPSNATWYIWDLLADKQQQYQWGLPGDIPVPGNYLGDERRELAVWRPTNGTWYIWNLSTGQRTEVQWGLPGDFPDPKDMNGDGFLDYIIWRESAKRFYRRS